MNLEQHISQLLYRYSCVTVPNFGAFLTEKVTASIQESNHTFYPPKKAVSFNVNIKNNDGLLANHVSQFENCSYDEAVSKINNQVNVWKNKLENRDFLIFKNIGVLKLNAENNIVFEAYENTNYLTESFGLSSYVSPVIKREVLKTVTNEELVEEINENKIVEIVPTNSNRFTARSIVKYAAVAAVFFSAGGYGYVNYLNQQEQIETLLVQKEVQKEVQSKIQTATFFISNPTMVSNESKDITKTPFYIVSGSYRSEENANKALKELIKKGFDAQILEKNDQDLYPVVYGAYSSYPEAQEHLASIQSVENKEAWLLIKE